MTFVHCANRVAGKILFNLFHATLFLFEEKGPAEVINTLLLISCLNSLAKPSSCRSFKRSDSHQFMTLFVYAAVTSIHRQPQKAFLQKQTLSNLSQSPQLSLRIILENFHVHWGLLLRANHIYHFHLYFFFLSVLEAFASIVCDLAPRLGTLKATRMLHIALLWAMMRAPLMFYDQTPIGRILSRFSSDTEATDNKIPEIVSDGIWCFFEVTKFTFSIILRGTAADCTQYDLQALTMRIFFVAFVMFLCERTLFMSAWLSLERFAKVEIVTRLSTRQSSSTWRTVNRTVSCLKWIARLVTSHSLCT